MALLENIRKLLQHLPKMQDLPADKELKSKSNTSQAHAQTTHPEALSSRDGLKFSTWTTPSRPGATGHPVLDPNTQEGCFLSPLSTSTPAVLSKHLDWQLVLSVSGNL